jgi:RNA polymerase sigma-70 factor (ECF subfamily)
VRRFLPLLRQWAHGRLPRAARDLHETDDLVQLALMRALKNLEHFEHEGPGSFLAYLRQILLNQVRDEVRRLGRRPGTAEIDPELPDADAPSPVERLVGSERLQAYERALGELPRRQQGLIVMRLELGMSYPEIAAETGSTPDAVRVMVARALVRLAAGLKPFSAET